MKLKQKFLCLFFLSIANTALNAQGIINEQTDGSAITTGFDTNAQEFNFFSQQSHDNKDSNTINVVNSGVFINQIGNNNRTNITAQSQISNIQLNQLGSSNQIDLKLRADIIDYSVIQNGNNNLLLEYNMYNDKQLLQRTVQQNGNNQNLVIHGRNGIVDKMKIKMDRGSQSIIIRNTN